MVLFIRNLPGVDIFEILLFVVEHLPTLIAINVIALPLTKPAARPFVCCLIPLFLTVAIIGTSIESYSSALNAGYDLSQPSLRSALEVYIETEKGPNGESLDSILNGGIYPPVFAEHEVKYLVGELLSETIWHSDAQNKYNVPVTYNKGNDWYRSTLGKPMVYTSAIYKTGKESLEQAQEYKIDYVANQIGLKKGDVVLDIGCGWGTLVEQFSKKYGAEVIGVTLSEEQVKYFNEEKAPQLPKGSKSKIILQDAMTMLENPEFKGKKFDKIVSLEMAEHVGIKRYQSFLSIVQELLNDDGTFYIQVAGLRRQWKFDDFVWGLFMGQNIFPGADASVPIGWVSTQLERGGFEVQRVSNLGTHYSKTLSEWLKEWNKGKPNIVQKYGEKAWRRWEVFLAWSVGIAREGSSTVFMITTTKQGQTSTRVDTQTRLAPIWK
eukprot:snap_masked-scaffold_89-processed-gene-0.31-mRNA-1 protein AED:0.16 eAED:0.16 QI:0/-1/0/1/-1/1/1/0/435